MIAEAADKPEEQQRLRGRISRLARSPVLSEWMVRELTAAGVPAATRMLLLQAMGDTGGQFTETDVDRGLADHPSRDVAAIPICRRKSSLPWPSYSDSSSRSSDQEAGGRPAAGIDAVDQDESRQPSTRLRALTRFAVRWERSTISCCNFC